MKKTSETKFRSSKMHIEANESYMYDSQYEDENFHDSRGQSLSKAHFD